MNSIDLTWITITITYHYPIFLLYIIYTMYVKTWHSMWPRVTKLGSQMQGEGIRGHWKFKNFAPAGRAWGPSAGPPDPPASLIIHILWSATCDEALKIAAKPRFLAPFHEKTKNLINYSCQPSFFIQFVFSNSLTDTHSGCFLYEISWRIQKKWTLSLKNSRTRSFSTFLTFLWKPDISFFSNETGFLCRICFWKHYSSAL